MTRCVIITGAACGIRAAGAEAFLDTS